ncbi:DMT family transporter [Oxalobacteraceae bacterium]|nr:DMT family transporter [Oxalobacteraceae bacterium]
MNVHSRPIIFLSIGGLIFSLSGVAVAYSSMGTSAVGFYRMLLGGLALAIFAYVKKFPFQTTRKSFIYACLAGFALALDMYWWHKSIRMVGPGLGAILTNCQSFSLAIFAYFLFQERITIVYFLSLMLALVGIFLISGMGAVLHGSGALSAEYIWGVAMGLGSAVAYALCVVFIKISQQTERPTHPVVNMVILCAAATLFLLVSSLAEGESLTIPDSKNLMTLIAYGLIVQGVAWLMVSSAIPYVKTSLAGLILLSEPVGTYLIDILFFSAKPTVVALAGIALTLTGVYVGSLYGTAKVAKTS